MEQWSRTEIPKTNAHIYEPLISTGMPRQFDKIWIVFPINGDGATRYTYAKNETGPLPLYAKFDLNGPKSLNTKAKTLRRKYIY